MGVRSWIARRIITPQLKRELTLDALGVPARGGNRRGLAVVTADSALRHSAVWACCRTRADLLSTFPVDTFRKVGGIDVEIPPAPVLVEPGGEHWPYIHWRWASDFELSRQGNSVGLITQRNALKLPSRIELQPLNMVQIYQRRNMDTHRYRIDGKEYEPYQVWHERQFPVAGLPVGLSPMAYAAWTLQESLSMQEFALDWFGGGAIPKAHLKNTKRPLENTPQNNEARRMKDRYGATMSNGEVFVTGNDWELDFIQAQQMGKEWLDGRRATIPDISRWFGVPVDLIEAAIESSSSTITYQNALQRNLQFLTMHLGPAIVRNEYYLSKLLPRPRFVKLNTNALLRLDPKTQAEIISMRLKDKTLTNDEARAYYNQAPLTQEQIDQFALLYGGPRTAPENASPADAATRAFYEQVSPLSAIPSFDPTGVS